MLEITPTLIEHYFRATGVKYDRLKLFAHIARDGAEDAALMYLDLIGLFRLGLCAAAERDLEEADHLTMPLGSMGMFTADDEYGASVLLAAAKRRLADAGIDPAAWESARKR